MIKFLLGAALVASFALADDNCNYPLSRDEYREKYCDADVVFTGRPTSGSSSLSEDENGNQVSHYTSIFALTKVYKGNIPSNRPLLTRRTVKDECEKDIDFAARYIVFANGVDYLETPPCDHMYAWDCVEKAGDDLDRVTC
ncbi:uncharacterized protein LOC131953426 [Physella acuta]|uniref:uncharacterized protein LOC131953426 n=1 Tax=Physella acuta TaxID=109671 RepID=UPI0027DCF058|nr:uncharacterized protein LOC131953426 [Physella acuta]